MSSRGGNPPPKPRRQNPPSQVSDGDENLSDEGYSPVVPRRRHKPRNRSRSRSRSPPPTPPNRQNRGFNPSLLDEVAETTIGTAVKMKGELSFERLLRIDGEFDGKLTSKGSLVIGPKGQLTGSIEGMKEIVVDGGKIIGDLQVQRVTIRAKGHIHGNITAKTIRIEPDCVVVGTMNVNPHAPECINSKGEPIPKETPKADSDAAK